MFCTKCGAGLPDEAPFCTNCGTNVRPAAQPAPPSELPEENPPETDVKAVASLVLGILALFFSIFAGIPAIVLGHDAFRRVKNSAGRLTGDSLALAGLALGYFSILLFPLLLMIALPRLLHSKIANNESSAEATVRTLNVMEITYSTTYPNAGFAPDLATLGPGATTCSSPEGSQKNACLLDNQVGCPEGTSGKWCSKDEYRYSIVGITNGAQVVDYVVTATPLSAQAGKRSFCSTSQIGVRYLEGQPLADPLKTAAECKPWRAVDR